jgi:hypothetical protein
MRRAHRLPLTSSRISATIWRVASMAHGFARARCAVCGYNFLIAFSCKGRGICPSCNTRRMVETSAHLVDHVFPQVPVWQWVLSFHKRLRYFLARDSDLLNRVLRIFLDSEEKALQSCCPAGSGQLCSSVWVGVGWQHPFPLLRDRWRVQCRRGSVTVLQGQP